MSASDDSNDSDGSTSMVDGATHMPRCHWQPRCRALPLCVRLCSPLTSDPFISRSGVVLQIAPPPPFVPLHVIHSLLHVFCVYLLPSTSSHIVTTSTKTTERSSQTGRSVVPRTPVRRHAASPLRSLFPPDQAGWMMRARVWAAAWCPVPAPFAHHQPQWHTIFWSRDVSASRSVEPPCEQFGVQGA